MKRLILIIFLGLLFCGSAFSQSLIGNMWQLQNPFQTAVSELFGFDENGVLNYRASNMNTGQTSASTGKYRLEGDNITFIFDNGQSFTFQIYWMTPNKPTLTKGNQTLILAKIGSSDDHFMENLLWSQNNGGIGSYTSGSYNGGGSNSSGFNICNTCNGNGNCIVCEGIGTCSGYSGGPHKCSACNGTGKCYTCGGSGKK